MIYNSKAKSHYLCEWYRAHFTAEGEALTYNIDFLIAALVLLGFVFVHFLFACRREDALSMRIFLVFVVVGSIDIVLDIVSACLFVDPLQHSLALLYGELSLFYLLQCLIPFLLFGYAVALCDDLQKGYIRSLLIAWIPFIVFIAVVVTNPWTHILFSFDPVTHVYTHGPFYFSMYLYAIFYCGLALIYVFLHRRTLRRVDFIAMWEYAIISASCVVLQYFHPGVLLTGLGIGLGITVMFFTINNPFEIIDPLTRVLETSGFKRKIASLVEKNRQFNVIFVSLDHLNVLNVIGGHDLSDELLKTTAAALVRVSGNKQVFRLKGSRFALVTFSRRENRRVEEELRSYFSETHEINGTQFEISASIGSISNASKIQSPEELQGYMDYLIAAIRRNDSVGLIETENGVEEYRRFEMIRSYVAHAIREDLLEVRFQPLYSIKDNRFIEFEALTRLEHPELGYIPADEVIEIAEREGYIRELGALQFEKVCRFARSHENHLAEWGIRALKVNLSPLELTAPDLGSRLLSTIRRYELDPRLFCFEVTETSATQYNDELDDLIRDLASVGATFCMDDFGSGFANLDTVLNLPFETVKIDRTLLVDAADSERAAKLYQSVLRVMSDLGYTVVSEGVETEEQVDLLRAWGSDMLQGYYYSEPLPLEEVFPFLRRRSLLA